MKNKFRLFVICFLGGLIISSCEDFLDKSPYSDITEDDIFANFIDMQAFVETNYNRMIDYNNHGQNSTSLYGDECLSSSGSHYTHGQLGDYWYFWEDVNKTGSSGILAPWKTNYGATGLWNDTWKTIRINNLALEKLNQMQGTPRQHDLIEGQAKFFRAFWTSELSKWVGGLPYITKTFDPNDVMNEVRLSSMKTMDNAVMDFDRAIELLPVHWDNLSKEDHPYQSYDAESFFSTNTGRATKGAAYAMKALAMLWAGSPLSNLASPDHIRPDGEPTGGRLEFDLYYMEEAAKAASEVIKLAEEQNVYQLVGFDEYQSFNSRMNNENPWVSPSGRKEVVWGYIPNINTDQEIASKTWCARNAGGGVGRNAHATENQVSRFETINGLPIDDPESGYDPQNPWENRDPRLKASVILPGDIVVGNIILTSWRDGRARSGMQSSMLIRKYLVAKNSQAGNVRMLTPYARLAEIYLLYAEALNELYGPNAKPTWGNYTAVEAVNIVRNRAMSYNPGSPDFMKPMMPPVNAKFTGSKDVFRERIRNERDVELAFEARRWMDLRRWHIAHLQENRVLYSMECDLVDGKFVNFVKEYKATKVFEEKNYWVPVPRAQAQLSEGFTQTPGW